MLYTNRTFEMGLEAERVLGCYVKSACCSKELSGELNLLAEDKFALRPVGCAVSFGVVPNLTGGAGPVFCGIRGAGICCCCI